MEPIYASHIMVEHFSVGHQSIDTLINKWLKQNPKVQVLDIKFSTNATDGSWGSDALIIYQK